MSIAVFAIRRFDAGRIEVTPKAEEAIDNNDIAIALFQHSYGDWGLVSDEGKLENEFALEHQLRLLSVYEDSNGKRFWIITEADRSATTVLLPEES